MEVWTRAQVLASAPDDASRRAALPLVSGRLWEGAGRAPLPPEEDGSEDAGPGELLWGRCHGSAAYAVVVAPGRSSRCSCPSRKSPCKHVLALLLRWVDGLVAPGQAPDWASVPSPAAPRASEAGPPGKGLDTEAAAARAAERRAKVDAGLEELDRWLADQVRAGLSGWERGSWARVEGVAARMVDAQAPGVAGVLRGLPGIVARAGAGSGQGSDGGGWPGHLLDALAGLHLLVVAHRGLHRLPPDLAATVRARVGYPVAKASVLAAPGVVDRWTALGAVDSLDGRLETRRVWLWGAGTGTWALLLSFAVPGAGLDDSVAVGDVLDAAVHRYPGAAEHRVLLGEQRDVDGSDPAGGPAWPQESVAQARTRWAGQLAADPWASRMPVVLRALPVRPERPGGPWWLADPDGTAVRLVAAPAEPWPLLAVSGGREVDVFGEWGPAGFVPVRLLRAGEPARLLAVA